MKEAKDSVIDSSRTVLQTGQILAIGQLTDRMSCYEESFEFERRLGCQDFVSQYAERN